MFLEQFLLRAFHILLIRNNTLAQGGDHEEEMNIYIEVWSKIEDRGIQKSDKGLDLFLSIIQ